MNNRHITRLLQPESAIWLAAAIFVGGTVLRLFGLNFGLPFIYDPDEPDVVERAFRMLASGDLSPHWFGHPGTTMMYLSSLVFVVYGAVGMAIGTFHSMADMAAAFGAEPSTFYFLARCVAVTFAAATIPLTYALARRVAGPYASLLAAALMAIAPLHVEHSRIARPDIAMTFLLLASTWFVLGIAERGRWRDYLLAGFLLGLAMATKYPALVLAAVIVLAHGLRQVDRGEPVWGNSQRLYAAGLATLAGAFVGSPYLFIDLPTALHDIAGEAQGNRVGVNSAGFLPSLSSYVAGTLRWNFGIEGLLLGILGAWSLWRRRDRAGLIMLTFPVVFLVFISSLTLRWDRWVIPVLPFVGVLAATGIGELSAVVSRLVPAWLHRLSIGAVVATTVTIPAIGPVLDAKALASAETRTMAWQWIMANVAPGSRILGEAYTPHLPRGRFHLYAVDEGQVWPLESGTRIYVVPRGVVGTLRDPGQIDRLHIDYVVMANHYDRRLRERERFQRQIRIYEGVMHRYPLVYEAVPEEGVSSGLTVRIYRAGR